MAMQFWNCTDYLMDSVDLQVMKNMRHKNYVNLQVKLKNRKYNKYFKRVTAALW